MLIGTDHHRDAALVTLLLLFGTAASGFTYLLSFLFKTASTGQNVVLSECRWGRRTGRGAALSRVSPRTPFPPLPRAVLNVLCVLLVGASFAMGAITASNVCGIDAGMRWLYRLLPGYALGNGIVALAGLDLLPSLVAQCAHESVSPFTQYDAFDVNAAGLNVVYLALETVLFLGATIGEGGEGRRGDRSPITPAPPAPPRAALDVALTDPRLRRLIVRDPKVPADAHYAVDEDVAAEAARIETLVGPGGAAQGRLAAASADVVVIDHLRKVRTGRRQWQRRTPS